MFELPSEEDSDAFHFSLDYAMQKLERAKAGIYESSLSNEEILT